MLKAVPVELKEANAFVNELHRHHMAVVRDKFRVGASEGGGIGRGGPGRKTLGKIP